MATATTTNPVEDATERIQDLNEQILGAGKKVGGAYLSAYEKTLDSILEYQQSAAGKADVEWLSTVIDAQTKLTREVSKAYVTAGRELLK